MRKALAYGLLLISLVLAVLLVATWVIGIRRDGLPATADALLNFPVGLMTFANLGLAIAFLLMGLGILMSRRNSA
jgi:hypothetical protein